MYKAILDASALLAFLKDEALSFMELEPLLPKSLISSVNACEVATVLNRLKIPPPLISELIESTVGEIVPFDKELYLEAATLWEITKPYGLSLGDRICLALAQQRKLPVYTTDKIWASLPLNTVEVILVR